MNNTIINVGIDIDGVLRDLLPYIYDKFKSRFPLIVKHCKPWKDITRYNTDMFFYMDEAHKEVAEMFREFAFYSIYTYDMYTKAPLLISSAFDFNWLINQFKTKLNANVYLVTDQRTYDQKASTLEWLEKNEIINYSGIYFTSNKHQCGLDYLLDDNPKHCREMFSVGKRGILRQQNTNRDAIDIAECYRVNSIKEYLNIILKLEINNKQEY